MTRTLLALLFLPALALAQDAPPPPVGPGKLVHGPGSMEVLPGWTAIKRIHGKMGDEDSHVLIVSLDAKHNLGELRVFFFYSVFPPADPKGEATPQGLLGHAFAYPMGLRAARNPEGEGVTCSFGEMVVGGARVGSCRLVFPIPGHPKQEVVTIEAGSRLVARKTSCVVAILSRGNVGRLNTQPAYHQRIREAYTMARGFRVTLPERGPK